MDGQYAFYNEDYPNDWMGIGHANIEDLSMETLTELLNEVQKELKRRGK